ncbi:MAG: LemA family protein [Verrucomicrobiota bacterium]
MNSASALLPLVIVAVVVVLPVVWAVATYNSLVALKNHIRDAWANIDTELKRRYDLIPNLVRTVQAYAAHERAVLEKVTELRNRAAGNHGSIASQAEDERHLVDGVQRLFALAEGYPDLKADQNFLQLQHELVNTEDRLQAARRFFNGNVRDYRNKCEQFPSNLIAGMGGFRPESYFEVEPALREAPPVELS